jgi:hypothetical protein
MNIIGFEWSRMHPIGEFGLPMTTKYMVIQYSVPGSILNFLNPQPKLSV